MGNRGKRSLKLSREEELHAQKHKKQKPKPRKTDKQRHGQADGDAEKRTNRAQGFAEMRMYYDMGFLLISFHRFRSTII